MNVILRMNYFYLLQESNPAFYIAIGFSVMAITFIVIYFIYHMIELVYVMKYNKPLYDNYYFHLKQLESGQINILEKQFPFYNKLEDKFKKVFEHRVACFVEDKNFIGRESLVVNDEKKVLISATACMLTFGFRKYRIGLIDHIFIYPNEFYSTINNEYHKGEFNPKLRALVLSWKDFKEGLGNQNDGMNLGIHEFAHAIHLNSLNKGDISSLIFKSSLNDLIRIISDKDQRLKLVESHFLRKYAFTNKFEFLAVTIESFFETPQEFKAKFPKIYGKVKQMLNFNFAEY